MKYIKIIILLCLVSIGCEKAIKNESIVAKVGRKVISNEEINKRIETLDPQLKEYFTQKENRVKLLDQIIDEEIIFQLAKKEGFTRNKEFKEQLKTLKKQALINFYVKKKVDETAQITKEEVENFYKTNINQFSEHKSRNLSHILVEKKSVAEKVAQLLKKSKGNNFEALAEKYSIDPSKNQKGSLGWVRKNQLVPEFANAAFKLTKKNRFSKIVKSQFGFHIIKFNDERIVPAQPLNTVYNSISNQMLTQKKRQTFTDLLKNGKDIVKIERNIENM